MKAGVIKRLGALLIDFLLIFLVANLFAGFLPNNSEMVAVNDEMTRFINENREVLTSNNIEEVEAFTSSLNDYSYRISRLSIGINLIKIILYFLYFIVFQSYNNGQTVGKKLLKIETVDESGNSPSFRQMLIRGIILYPIVLSLLDIILIAVLNKSMYLDVSIFVAYLKYAIYLACFITVIISGRGIHDKLAGTSVIKVGSIDSVEESKVSKWKQTASREKETKKYRVNHTSGKRKE